MLYFSIHSVQTKIYINTAPNRISASNQWSVLVNRLFSASWCEAYVDTKFMWRCLLALHTIHSVEIQIYIDTALNRISASN